MKAAVHLLVAVMFLVLVDIKKCQHFNISCDELLLQKINIVSFIYAKYLSHKITFFSGDKELVVKFKF